MTERPHRPRRRLRPAIAVATALATTGTLAVVSASSPASATMPTAAVALGDSFISGEGAGNYQTVAAPNGAAQGFNGWSGDNGSGYYCHRSANASIEVASLPGIDARFNLACSGGQPHDIASPSYARANGRNVASQIDQLTAVAQTHDIDVVLIGLGSNNASFTFGQLASKCVETFLQDAWIGWWEFWASPWNKDQDPCSNSDFPSSSTRATATAETVAAVRQVLQTLDQVDADGEHRVVIQDYTNPLPLDFASRYHKESGRKDTRDKFRALGRERYAAGCPTHRASLGPAATFTANLGSMVETVRNTLAAEFPNDELVYLNVQRAFDGARLCENSNSPSGVLATPVRFQKNPNGSFEQTMNGWDKLDLQDAAETCTSYYQTCQESLHPNAAGHAVLGQCLTAATTATRAEVDCSRNSSSGAISTSQSGATLP